MNWPPAGGRPDASNRMPKYTRQFITCVQIPTPFSSIMWRAQLARQSVRSTALPRDLVKCRIHHQQQQQRALAHATAMPMTLALRGAAVVRERCLDAKMETSRRAIGACGEFGVRLSAYAISILLRLIWIKSRVSHSLVLHFERSVTMRMQTISCTAAHRCWPPSPLLPMRLWTI
jgi:hypothetical protein